MMTLREKRHREVTNTLNRTIAQREAAIATIVRCEARLKTLRRQAFRLERAMAQPVTAKPEPKPQPAAPAPAPQMTEAQWKETLASVKPLPAAILAEAKATADELDIPDYLKRDAKAKAEIEQANADRKRTKSQVRIEKMKAKQGGETKKMPLTGKAALEFIRNG